MAIRALDAWGRDQWPEEALEVLEACRSREPVADLQLQLKRLVAGEPTDP